MLINELLLLACYFTFPLITSFFGLFPPLLFQVEFAEQPAVLLENLVINHHAVRHLMLSLPHRRGRGSLAASPQVSAGTRDRRRHKRSLVEVIDVMPVVEGLHGSVLLTLAPALL